MLAVMSDPPPSASRSRSGFQPVSAANAMVEGQASALGS